jgi:MFS family permease
MTGSCVSMLGSRITAIAYPLLALYLTNSPTVAGLVAFTATAPYIVVYMPAGALVDRWDPRRTLLVCESGRGAAIAIFTVTLAAGRLSVFQLVAAVLVEKTLEIFSTLADQRYIRSLVPPDQASSAQASVEVRAHTVMLAGRPIGGLLFSLAPILPFFADALSFAVSVSTIARLTSNRVVAARSVPVSWRPQLKQLENDISTGLKWMLRDRYARASMTLSAGATLIAQALIMIVLAEAHTSRLSSFTVGLVLAASGAGGVLGSVAASRLPRPPKASLILVQMLAWAGTFAVLAASGGRSLLCLAIVMAALSVTGALGNIEIGTYLVRNVDENMLARVTSIGRLMTFSAVGGGPVLGGGLIQWYGAQHAVRVLFMMTLALALLAMCSPAMRYREVLQ